MALVLPHSPACLVGDVPFTGLSGRLAGMVGLGGNRANPLFTTAATATSWPGTSTDASPR
jgi:hypothetical protein